MNRKSNQPHERWRDITVICRDSLKRQTVNLFALMALAWIPTSVQEVRASTDNSSTNKVIEEVIVSATKKAQVSQKVPISMSVMSDEFIVEQGITDITEALTFVPNFTYEEVGVFSTPRCRGFSVDGRNLSFEPPCGIAIDGVSYTRPAFFRTAMIDLQRMEVLRGPQGTTFGKNTTAGIVSLVTKDPTDELTANVNFQYGERNRRRVEAGVGGPIIRETVNFRLAVLKEKVDGYIKNTAADIRGAEAYAGGVDREGFRVKLFFPNVFNSDLKFTYENFDIFNIGLPQSYNGQTTPFFRRFVKQYDPDANFDPWCYCQTQDEPTLTSTMLERYQIDWSYDLSGWIIEAVGAYAKINDSSHFDADFTPAPAIDDTRSQQAPSSSLEVRLLSPDLPGIFGLKELFGNELGQSNVLLGVYRLKEKLKTHNVINVRDYSTGAVATALTVDDDTTPVPPPYEDTLLGRLGIPEPTEFNIKNYTQEQTTLAAFAQFTWNVTDRWMFEIGGRISKEKKNAQLQNILSDPAPVLEVILDEFETSGSVQRYDFQPKVTIGYLPTGGLSFFARGSRGFKSGGFNQGIGTEPGSSSRFDGQQVAFLYEPEVATEWAFDAKMKLFDGAMRLNLSLFRLTIEDFQVFTFLPEDRLPSGERVPFTSFATVLNAGMARSQGFEADLMYLPTNWLTVIGTVGLSDTEFLDFKHNACGATSNSDGDDDDRCDVTGRMFQGTPKWNNTLTLMTTLPLDGISSWLEGVELTASSTVEYFSSKLLEATLVSSSRQSSFYRYKAQVGISKPSQGWSVQVIGKNLTNERTATQEVANTQSFAFHTPEPPRAIYTQFTWHY